MSFDEPQARHLVRSSCEPPWWWLEGSRSWRAAEAGGVGGDGGVKGDGSVKGDGGVNGDGLWMEMEAWVVTEAWTELCRSCACSRGRAGRPRAVNGREL